MKKKIMITVIIGALTIGVLAFALGVSFKIYGMSEITMVLAICMVGALQIITLQLHHFCEHHRRIIIV
jgi:hypothetical protein